MQGALVYSKTDKSFEYLERDEKLQNVGEAEANHLFHMKCKKSREGVKWKLKLRVRAEERRESLLSREFLSQCPDDHSTTGSAHRVSTKTTH